MLSEEEITFPRCPPKHRMQTIYRIESCYSCEHIMMEIEEGSFNPKCTDQIYEHALKNPNIIYYVIHVLLYNGM